MVILVLLLPALPNLDFRAGTLTHWEGAGFALKAGRASSETASKHPALLHRTFEVPANALSIQFQALVVRPAGTRPAGLLDVWMEAPGRVYLPRQRWQDDRWVKADDHLSAELTHYRWPIESHAGRRVRIALADLDDRPGCFLLCTGFRITTRDDEDARLFERDLRTAEKSHSLNRFQRYETRHFLAFGNAGVSFIDSRLEDCELMYSSFFRHFRKRGFELTEPPGKLLVAVFRTQDGFEKFLGQRVGPTVTGAYHLPTNRLLVYDYATNPSFVRAKRDAEEAVRLGRTDLERHGRGVVLGRALRDHRDDINISTMMHEVAHQLSFNTGLLNRKADVPAWLAEGLAMYCEPSIKGSWQGIGESNPPRARDLAAAKPLLTVRALVLNDDWLRKAKTSDEVIRGYAQSWALFRLLMEERPRQLRAYLKAIHGRRGPEHRFTDFATAFGDLKHFEIEYLRFVRSVARLEGSD